MHYLRMLRGIAFCNAKASRRCKVQCSGKDLRTEDGAWQSAFLTANPDSTPQSEPLPWAGNTRIGRMRDSARILCGGT
jgi:hypothetical protein